MLRLRGRSAEEVTVARYLYTTCLRYFQGDGCFRCPLCRVCDRQGYVPTDSAAPALRDDRGVEGTPIRPDALTSSDLKLSAES